MQLLLTFSETNLLDFSESAPPVAPLAAEAARIMAPDFRVLGNVCFCNSGPNLTILIFFRNFAVAGPFCLLKKGKKKIKIVVEAVGYSHLGLLRKFG